MDIADGNLQKARLTLDGWQQTTGQDLDFLLHSASLSWGERQYSTALAQYEKVLSVDGNNLVALNNIAYLLASSLDRADDAIGYAQRAKEVAPNEPAVDDTLGWAYYHKGLFGEAVKYLEAAANASTDPAIQYHLGLAYLKQGDRRGFTVTEAALQAAPNSPDAAIARQALSASR
jgi:tetratricopeptide (TPR) repeat protein